MNFRIAEAADIPQIMEVRLAVRENILNNRALVTDEHCREMLEERGRGWVCEMDGVIVGFSIVDLREKNVWALFLLPEFEKRGIGKRLHDLMIDWAFEQGIDHLWLSTGPGTRAVGFYHKMGWQEAGRQENGEIRFEMSAGRQTVI